MNELVVVACLGFVAGAALTYAACAKIARAAFVSYTVRAAMAGARAAQLAAANREISAKDPAARAFATEREAMDYARRAGGARDG